MRILALADIHGSPRGETVVRNLVRDTGPGVIAIAGDLTGPSGLAATTELLRGLPVPAFIVPGNMDGGAAADAFTVGKARNIDLGKAALGGFLFVGLGGNAVLRAERRGLSGELRAIEEKLAGLMTKDVVFLTHVPPFGHLDSVPIPPAFSAKVGEAEHIGSHFIQGIVERFRPVLVISGHVHEHRGVEREGGTLYVNPGPARDGFGAVIELKGRVMVKLVESPSLGPF
jgi:Icc-related predicted phosphoesterase